MIRTRFVDEKIAHMGPEQPADNAMAQIATGVGKAVEGLISFPNIALQYITGTTRHLGEQASWSQIGRRFSGDYFDDPATRAIDVVNHMIFGTLDLISGHLLHRAAETLGIQSYTPFFSAPPTTIEGWATDITNIGFLFALPAAGKALKSSMGIPAKPIAVSETALFKEWSEVAERAEWQAMVTRAQARMTELAVARNQATRSPSHFNAWMREGQGVWGSQRGAIGMSPEPQVSAIIQRLGRPLYDRVAEIDFVDLIKDPRGPLRSPHITLLLEVVRIVRGAEPSPASNALYNACIHKPELFLLGHIDPILAMAANEPGAYFINYSIEVLVFHRPELFTSQHVARLRSIAQGHEGPLPRAIRLLIHRGRSAPDLRVSLSQTPRATDADLVDAVEMELHALLTRQPPAQTRAAIPGHVQAAQLLKVTTEALPGTLYDIAKFTARGLVILRQCADNAAFRDQLFAALQQMQRETPESSWLGEALKHVQQSAAEPDLEI